MSRMEVIQGNITKLPIDAIVNTAKQSLLGGLFFTRKCLYGIRSPHKARAQRGLYASYKATIK